jgi:dipeptidyl aminopeptidase/acylaminoacyl peptidase
MKKKAFLLLIITSCSICYGQKKTITDTSYKEWTSIARNETAISNDGKYAVCTITNQPLGGSTMVVTSTDKVWIREFEGYRSAKFTADSKTIYALNKDTLVQINLGKSQFSKTAGISSFQLKQYKKKEWLIYKMKDTLFVKNLTQGKLKAYNSVKDFIDNRVSGSLILKMLEENTETLTWLDLHTGKLKNIYNGRASSNYIFDPAGKKLAFALSDSTGYTLWYYDGLTVSRPIASNTSANIAPNFKISIRYTWAFSDDGKSLFFTQGKPENPKKEEQHGADIWSYEDAYLMTRYNAIRDDIHNGENLTSIDLENNNIIQLLHGLQRPVFNTKYNNRFLVIESSFGMGEYDWNFQSQKKYELCFVKTREFLRLEFAAKGDIVFQVAPAKDLLIYYNSNEKAFFCYTINSGKTNKIATSGKQLGTISFRDVANPFPPKFVCWIQGTNHFIVQDKYDLWELDPTNNVLPRNITNGIGTRDSIIFSFAENPKNSTISKQLPILLFGFNQQNKANSLYQLDLKNFSLKNLLTSNEYIGRPYGTVYSQTIFKAENTDAYLLEFQSVSHTSNLRFTKDFNEFTDLTSVYPEAKYNWLRSELLTYADSDGNSRQAILYKPENFDPRRKYPVVFQYYGEITSELNKYIEPVPVAGALNIPIMVSSGYLVVTPDIHFQKGSTGNTMLKCVLGAANCISKYSWVDSTKMGLIGHSEGGAQTNFIITHSNKFAAAVAEAAVSNYIQEYNDIWAELMLGHDKHDYITAIAGGGYSMDSMPDIYVKNSAVLYAKNITTPLLLIHNYADQTVNVTQTRQMFVQMRSLQKKVWWVSYDGEHHTIQEEKNQIDHQDKVKSFFDYFLRDFEKPKWMKQSIRYEN